MPNVLLIGSERREVTGVQPGIVLLGRGTKGWAET